MAPEDLNKNQVSFNVDGTNRVEGGKRFGRKGDVEGQGNGGTNNSGASIKGSGRGSRSKAGPIWNLSP